MSSRGIEELIIDIYESLKKIISYSNGILFSEFRNNTLIQDSVIRNFEIIGEASKKINIDIKMKYDSVPWKKIAGLRDRLIHDYFGINYDIVWDTIKNDVPIIKIEIEKIITDLNIKME